jgi:hypothetical protein
MTDIQRYSPYAIACCADAYGQMKQDNSGDWVSFEDHKALLYTILQRGAERTVRHDATVAALEAKLAKAVDVITCILATAYADDHTGWHNALDDARAALTELEAKP